MKAEYLEVCLNRAFVNVNNFCSFPILVHNNSQGERNEEKEKSTAIPYNVVRFSKMCVKYADTKIYNEYNWLTEMTVFPNYRIYDIYKTRLGLLNCWGMLKSERVISLANIWLRYNRVQKLASDTKLRSHVLYQRPISE